jgi:hypothetical protein
MTKLFIILLIFLLGLYYVTNYHTVESFDTLGNKSSYRCPNVLIQKGSAFFLFNTKLAKIPGINPLRFNSLDEYTEFTDWQRSQGIRCPILYVQESYDAQGNQVYKARPSPTDMQGGLPDLMPADSDLPPTDKILPPFTKLTDATRTNPPFNRNSYPAYDQQNQYIGLETPLDKMFHEKTGKVSPNPMDSNWGGIQYTQSLIDSGYYADDEVDIKIA